MADVADAGVWLRMRLIAGVTRQMENTTDGTLSIGMVKKAKTKDVEAWARTLPGMQRKATGLCKRLKAAGLITIGRTGIIKIARWQEEQESANTPAAARKRRSRLQMDMDAFLDAISDQQGEYVNEDELIRSACVRLSKRQDSVSRICEACISAGNIRRVDGTELFIQNCESSITASPSGPCSPPSTSEFRHSVSGGDMSHPDGVTCHIESKGKERGTNVPSNFDQSPSAPSGGEQGPEGRKAAGLTRQDIHTGSPLDVCAQLVGERGDWAANGFGKKLRELRAMHGETRGTRIFRDCMESLHNDMQEGARITKPAAVLHGKLNKWLNSNQRKTA